MTYENLINTMQDFLLNEPSGDFQLLDDKIRLCKYNGIDEYDIERIADVANGFDGSGNLTLIYLASLCRRQIEDTVAPVTYFLCNESAMDKYRKCLECVNSHEVKDCRAKLVDRLAIAISSVSDKKVIGCSKDIDAALDGAIDDIFKEFKKLKFEVYAKSGSPVGTMDATAMSVQVCGSLAECLIRLEKSKDGIYICFISNPGTLDGWFGFFVKSNGNLFSYNERINEAYAGQHRNMRNGRYAEYGKAYGLFPYELCEFSEETDYKGYSTEMRIGENRDLFDGKNLEMAVRVFLTMALISQKHMGEMVKGLPVIVNSLLPNNIALLAEKEAASDTTAVVEWRGSPIVEHAAKSAVPTFELSKVLNGEYNKDFDQQEGGGIFKGIRQDVVDSYGDGFSIRQENILLSNSSLRLIGKGDCEQEFIGTKDRLRAQAYYEVREQLRDYIVQRMEDEYRAFGGSEQLRKWYREHLLARKDAILKYCLDSYNSKKTDDEGNTYGTIYINSDKDKPGIDSRYRSGFHAVEVRVSDKTGMGFWGTSMLSQSKDGRSKCWITGSEPSYYFRFSFFNYQQVEEFIGCNLPKFCTGWERDHFESGNSILYMVDPIDQMVLPLEHRGDSFSFDVAVALSKSGIKKLKKKFNVEGGSK